MFRDEDSSSVFMRDSSQWVSIESPRTLIKKVGKETILTDTRNEMLNSAISYRVLILNLFQRCALFKKRNWQVSV
jgi:hypothetical protein